MTSAEVAAAIPILKPENFHKGSFDGPNNTHCLLGHRNKLPSGLYTAMNGTMLRTLKRTPWGRIAGFNDDPRTSKDELAAFWNKARRRVIQNAWRNGGL